jgi:hypothetical protein
MSTPTGPAAQTLPLAVPAAIASSVDDDGYVRIAGRKMSA